VSENPSLPSPLKKRGGVFHPYFIKLFILYVYTQPSAALPFEKKSLFRKAGGGVFHSNFINQFILYLYSAPIK
jgi:hypothetical protein